MPRPDHLLAYFGHHKCASTWIHTIVSHACDEAGLTCSYATLPESFGGDLPAWAASRGTDFLCYVNADLAQLEGLPELRGFHVVRDPRDILTSAYFSHLHSHKTEAWPALVEHRERLRALDEHDGLLLELDFNAEVFRRMLDWDYEQPHVLELRMETLVADPLNGFLEIFRFLGFLDETHYSKRSQARHLLESAANVLQRHGKQPWRRPLAALPAERLLGIVHDNRFETKTGGRREGEEDVASHYRKGVAGDWKRHFRPAHVAAFQQRYNELLLMLGYEQDPDWNP